MYMGIDAAWGDEGTLAIQYLRISRQTLNVASNTDDDTVFNANVLSNNAICWVDLDSRMAASEYECHVVTK